MALFSSYRHCFYQSSYTFTKSLPFSLHFYPPSFHFTWICSALIFHQLIFVTLTPHQKRGETSEMTVELYSWSGRRMDRQERVIMALQGIRGMRKQRLNKFVFTLPAKLRLCVSLVKMALFVMPSLHCFPSCITASCRLFSAVGCTWVLEAYTSRLPKNCLFQTSVFRGYTCQLLSPCHAHGFLPVYLFKLLYMTWISS